MLFLSDFNKTRNFSTIFSKNPRISNFKKIRKVGAEFFHADKRMDGGWMDGRWMDGWTEMTKLIVAFRKFANASTNMSVHLSMQATK